MELPVIETDEQHARSLAEVWRLAESDPHFDSADGARLELLARLIEDYEKQTFPLDKAGPIASGP